MENIIVELSKYIIIILMAIYSLYCFTVFRSSNKKRQNKIFFKQNVIMFTIHFIAYLVLYLNTNSLKVIYLYLAQVLLFSLILLIYKTVYKNLSRLVQNNMLMLIMVSLIMLTRLSYDKAVKQFAFVAIGSFVCLLIPYLIKKIKYLSYLGWIYGMLGLIFLIIVLGFGKEIYGAKNWISIGGFLFQPSEFVKILFVFAVAALLAKSTKFVDVVKVTILAGAHVIVLVLSKDLGGALIFFVTYLVMLYVATGQYLYFLSGILAGGFAAFIAYKLFSHVQVRVMAWKDPFSVIDNQGYQVTQSLFAIGTGGWFGMGLSKGLPTSIPVVDSDFVFSAISEELGGIFGICLILVCISCFIMFINIALKMKRQFYKLVALGFSIMYIFQVFLSIGGVTKFIPSTGVTLPLVSYGGSSMLSMIIIFCIIQGLYVLNQDGDENNEKVKKEFIKQNPERRSDAI